MGNAGRNLSGRFRETLEAWQTKLAVLRGLIEPEEEPEVAERWLTIDQAIQKYLVEVEATKSESTLRQYTRELGWFRKHRSLHGKTNLVKDDCNRAVPI
jgi:hypothetical protein